MRHPDGIEVYLKPSGTENEDVKFAEFPLREFESFEEVGEEHNRRCLVLAREENLDVVIRCLPSFKMYSASALINVVDDGQTAPEKRCKSVIQQSLVYEQKVKSTFGFGKLSERRRAAYKMAYAREALSGQFDNEKGQSLSVTKSAKGSIRVIVFRGTADWRDSSSATASTNRFYGPGDPTKFRRRRRGTSRPLESQRGQKYTFEFKYRSAGCIREVHKNIHAQDGTQSTMGSDVPIEKIALIKDNDFRRIRKEDQDERKKTGDAYKTRQALANEGNDSTSTTIGEGLPRGNQLAVPNDKRPKPEPEFCNCGNPSHARLQTLTRNAKMRAPGLASPVQPQQKNPERERPVSPPEVSRSNDNSVKEASQEDITPPICSKCKKLKAPNFRRPAFLRKWYANELETRDEQVPTPQASIPYLLETEASEALTASAVEKANFDSNDEVDGSDIPTEASSILDNEVQQHEQVEEATVSNSPETSEAVQQQSSTPPISKPLAPASDIPGIKSTPQKETQSESTVATSDDQSAQSTFSDQDNDGETIDGQETTKRALEPEIEERPSKKQRIEIDLTMDDDDDIVVIKEESKAQLKLKPQDDTPAKEDEADLQAQLEDVLMKEEQLELKRQRMVIQRKLEALRKKKTTPGPAIKTDEIIKIED